MNLISTYLQKRILLIFFVSTRRRCQASRLHNLIIVAMLSVLLAGCNLEQRAWDSAEKSKTYQAFDEFLRKYPNSRYNKLAKSEMVSLKWRETVAINTQNAYREFLAKFPDSAFAEESEAKSKDFIVKIVGRGEIDLPGIDRPKTRSGPVIELLPQGEQRKASLEENSSYAINKSGQKVLMRYFISIDLGGHSGSIIPNDASTETWIPKVNTFTNRYYAIGTANNQVHFLLEFKNKEQVAKFGIIYEEDYTNLSSIHILGNTIKVTSD